MSSSKKCHVVVLGNEKGGTGKSTVSMHIITSLLRQGFSVGSIDIDARQGTLTRYLENRQARKLALGEDLPLPNHVPLHKSALNSVEEAQKEDTNNLNETISKLSESDYIVIDTPGSDTFLSRLAHSFANTLITPLNDSFIDLDMLVRVKSDSMDTLKPSTYSEMVWEQKKQRAIRNGGSIDWIVIRNRLSSIHSRNKEEMEKVLSVLSKRIGFRFIYGFGERVIFRELFLNGLTLLDLKESNTSLSLSHIAAKQELTCLMDAIKLSPKSKRVIA